MIEPLCLTATGRPIFRDQKPDTKSATGRLILTIFAGFAQFERETMLERPREGIAKAKAEGKYWGRKPTARANAIEVHRLHNDGKTPTEIAQAVGISRGSVCRIE